MSKFKKTLAVFLCAAILLCGSCSQTATNEKARANKKLTEITYEGYSLDKANSIVSDIREKFEGNYSDLKAKQICNLFDELLTEFDVCTTQYTIKARDYEADPQNENNAAEYNDIMGMANDLEDMIKTTVGELYVKGYSEKLIEHTGCKRLSLYADYTTLTDEMQALSDRDDELSLDYMRISTSGASGQELYENIGSIIVDLVGIRNEYARLKGYDNYIDYAFKEIYFRDYTMQQFMSCAQYIRTYLSEAYFSMREEVTDTYHEDFDSARLTEGLRRIAEDGSLPAKVREAAAYCLDYEMIYTADPNKSLVSTWCGKLYTQNEPMMYVYPTNDISDSLSLLHESGHYLNFFLSEQPSFYDNMNSLEIAETQSQGYMLMYYDEFSREYPEQADAIKTNVEFELLRYVYESAMDSEFEYRLYCEENLTYDRANEIYEELCGAYGYSYTPGVWARIPHYVNSPGYMPSYAVSALAAAALWNVSLTDDERANALYSEISAYGCDISFMQMCEKCGFEDVFGEEFLIRLKNVFEAEK